MRVINSVCQKLTRWIVRFQGLAYLVSFQEPESTLFFADHRDNRRVLRYLTRSLNPEGLLEKSTAELREALLKYFPEICFASADAACQPTIPSRSNEQPPSARSSTSAMSSGGSLLNLFCHSGSFSVAACVGSGATSTLSTEKSLQSTAFRTTNVDVSPHFLAQAKRNLRLNLVDERGHSFIENDALLSCNKLAASQV